MREIKFRAWDKERKKMLYEFPEGIGIDLDGTIYNTYTFEYDEEYAGCKIMRHLILLQYTSLKDKNGKEIYEGDIVEHNEDGEKTIKTVKYVESNTGYYLRGEKGEDKDPLWCINNYTVPKMEIIGNIYENENFLKDKK